MWARSASPASSRRRTRRSPRPASRRWADRGMAGDLQLSAPALADAQALLDFELANRAYFESWINARGDGYYNLPAVRASIEQAARERGADQAYQFLLKDDGVIVGRVNLRAVTRPYFNKATLGYRIGEQYVGRGYASRAVALALEQAFGALELWRVEAACRPENAASVRVLERNGFTVFAAPPAPSRCTASGATCCNSSATAICLFDIGSCIRPPGSALAANISPL